MRSGNSVQNHGNPRIRFQERIEWLRSQIGWIVGTGRLSQARVMSVKKKKKKEKKKFEYPGTNCAAQFIMYHFE